MKYSSITAFFACLVGSMAAIAEEAVDVEAPTNVQLRGNRNLAVLASWGTFQCGRVGTASTIVLNVNTAVECTVTIAWGDGVQDVSSFRSSGAKSMTISHSYKEGEFRAKFSANCQTPPSASGSTDSYVASAEPVSATKYTTSDCKIPTFFDFLAFSETNTNQGFDEASSVTAPAPGPGTFPPAWASSP